MTVITRKEYLASSDNLHHAYYIQFATPALRKAVARQIGADAIKASKDEWFNDITFRRWDMLESVVKSLCDRDKLREADPIKGPPGTFVWCNVTSVCIAKAIAREIRDAG